MTENDNEKYWRTYKSFRMRRMKNEEKRKTQDKKTQMKGELSTKKQFYFKRGYLEQLPRKYVTSKKNSKRCDPLKYPNKLNLSLLLTTPH